MSSSNPQQLAKNQERISAVASTFSLPPLPTSNTTIKHSTPSINDGHLFPAAVAALKQMLQAEHDFQSNTEVSVFATLPKTTPTTTSSMNKVHVPQPPSSNSKNNTNNNSDNRGAAYRSALVREAARFVEDPESYRDAYKRVYSIEYQQQHQKEYEQDHQEQGQEEETSEKENINNNSTTTEPSTTSMIILYDREYEEKMRTLLLKRSPTDGHSNLQDARKIEESLQRNTIRDHQAFLASQRLEIEQEESTLRNNMISISDELFTLLITRNSVLIEEFFEDRVLELEQNERRTRLDLETVQFTTQRCQLRALFVSGRLLLRFIELWRNGIEKTNEVLHFGRLDQFVIRQTEAARFLQRISRGYQSRQELAQIRWRNSVGPEQISKFISQVQFEFSETQRSLKRSFQRHGVEAFEQYCRRVILEQAFQGLFTIHFNANQTFIILGEYDARRRLLVEEEQSVSHELLPNANSTRYDLYHVISSRLKLGIKKRFQNCQHVRDAVLCIQNRFARPLLIGEFGRTSAKKWIHERLREYFESEPVRPITKLNKSLKKKIREDESILLLQQQQGQEHKTPERRGSSRMENENKSPFSPFEKLIAPFCSAEEAARSKIISAGLSSLRRLYKLCFLEGSYSAIVGVRQESEACFDAEEDERWFNSKPKHEILLRDPTRVEIEAEIRRCECVVDNGSGDSSVFFLVTQINNRPPHLAFASSTMMLSNNNQSPSYFYSKICNQFLEPFEVLRPHDFSEIEWYRLRGAVDVSYLIEDAFSRNKNRNAEIYARTIGQLVQRKRATTAEVRQQRLNQLRRHAVERLQVEVEEWNTRWVSALEMLQEHSFMLLQLDWQRSWMSLREFCEQDEVVTLQYLATQNFDQYRRDVAEVLRGVHGAAIKIHEEKNWVPKFVREQHRQNNNNANQILLIEDKNKTEQQPHPPSSPSSAMKLLEEQKKLIEEKLNKRMYEMYLESQRTCTPLGELLRKEEEEEVVVHVDDDDAADNENNIHLMAGQQKIVKAEVNFYDDSSSDENDFDEYGDDHEHQNINYWEELRMQYDEVMMTTNLQEQEQEQEQHPFEGSMYDELESEVDEVEIINKLLRLESEDHEAQEKQAKFYQDLYGASDEDEEEIVF